MRLAAPGIFALYSYGQKQHLMAKTTPTLDVVDDHDDHYAALLWIPRPKMRR
jgi:hypothetical protein